jgi:hypothetical protein
MAHHDRVISAWSQGDLRTGVAHPGHKLALPNERQTLRRRPGVAQMDARDYMDVMRSTRLGAPQAARALAPNTNEQRVGRIRLRFMARDNVKKLHGMVLARVEELLVGGLEDAANVYGATKTQLEKQIRMFEPRLGDIVRENGGADDGALLKRVNREFVNDVVEFTRDNIAMLRGVEDEAVRYNPTEYGSIWFDANRVFDTEASGKADGEWLALPEGSGASGASMWRAKPNSDLATGRVGNPSQYFRDRDRTGDIWRHQEERTERHPFVYPGRSLRATRRLDTSSSMSAPLEVQQDDPRNHRRPFAAQRTPHVLPGGAAGYTAMPKPHYAGARWGGENAGTMSDRAAASAATRQKARTLRDRYQPHARWT